MEPSANLLLSESELANVQDAGWILTKHLIMEKAAALLRSQVNEINNRFGFLIKEEGFRTLTSSWPKISRGENYLQLPYLILDHPAIFDKNNIFALRTFFWWGNFFSINLHLSGTYKKTFEPILASNVKNHKNLYYCISEDEWQHHFETGNFKKIPASFNSADFYERKFIKLAFKYPLKSWNTMPQLLQKGYAAMAGLLQEGN
ncbi:MAG: hypothetical protein JST57_04365 [Bacteroidetes bacterium]|mgnify:FL=1|nr:hypothetical protein [Bacteroidota bacterium]MCC6692140.1 hypothetical protein [Chitinophagaceae bacterium]HMU24108.1 hypothetical protein [Ferruginibacter sp.]